VNEKKLARLRVVMNGYIGFGQNLTFHSINGYSIKISVIRAFGLAWCAWWASRN